MGVKSTKTLTKREAIEKYVELKSKEKEKKWRRKAENLLEDNAGEFERLLEYMNDAANGGEGFENYDIDIWSKD